MTLHHGTNKEFAAHIGLCLTPCDRSASHYGDEVFSFEFSAEGLEVKQLDASAWDRDNQIAVGDSAESLEELAAEGVDVVVYQDEDPFGCTHMTYRFVSEKSLLALTM